MNTVDWSPEPGQVAFVIEVWSHNAGENGRHYSAGCLSAEIAIQELRRVADQIEREWIQPLFIAQQLDERTRK